MGAAQILDLAGTFGPMGLFVGYLIWREMRREKLDRDRIDADLKLATALALLEAAVKGWPR